MHASAVIDPERPLIQARDLVPVPYQENTREFNIGVEEHNHFWYTYFRRGGAGATMDSATSKVLKFNAQTVAAASSVGGKQTEWRIEQPRPKKYPKDQPFALIRGLVLVVQPSGSGAYYAYYKARVGKTSKLRKYRIGSRDITSLETAHDRVTEIMQLVEAGRDPVAEGVARRTALTFRELCDERFKKDHETADSTKNDYRMCLERDVYPAIGDKPATEVTAEMVVDILDKIEGRDAVTKADKTKAAIGSMFKFGRKRGLVKHDPTQGLGNRATATPRDRVLSDGEIKKLWLGIESGAGSLSARVRLILKLSLVTGQRESEVAGAMVSELDLEGSEPTWTIAGDKRAKGRAVKGRTKNRKEQIVPLSAQAVELFKAALAIGSGKDGHLFPADRDRVKVGNEPKTPHIAGRSIAHAMARLREKVGVDDVVVHDFRRCVSTWLGERDERLEVIDKILNHQPRGVTAKHYNHARLLPQTRIALQKWADHIERVVSGAPERSNILKIGTR